MADLNGVGASPRAEALAWWKGRIEAESYVGSREELPDAAVVRYLRSQDLLAETPGGWGWAVLGGANSDPEAALRRNYWPLIRTLLSRYAPAAIDRISAVRLHVGESHLLPVL